MISPLMSDLRQRKSKRVLVTSVERPDREEGTIEMLAVTPEGAGSLLQHERFAASLPGRPGVAEVFLGVRPEEIVLARSAGEGITRGIVERTELIGSEALAEILIGQDRVVARMPVSEAPESGAEKASDQALAWNMGTTGMATSRLESAIASPWAHMRPCSTLERCE